MNSAVNNIFKSRKIRNTASRATILTEFVDQNCALSQPDLEKTLGHKIDRVTIYRTLNLFLDKSIIHKVIDDSGSAKYALCSEMCDDHGHNHSHVHFQCEICGQTSCLDELKVPGIQLPAGYKMKEVNYLITGVCKNC